MICDKITADMNCNTVVNNEAFDPAYIYIYILQLNKYNGDTISQTFVRTSPDEDIVFTIGQDGYYTLCKLQIPLDESNPYYYKGGKIYKNIQEVDLKELLQVNPEVSKIGVTYYYYFQLCKLRKCYIGEAQKVLNNVATIRCDTRINSSDTYKRDLLLTAINVISYLAEMEQFEEAERLLERIIGCNGLCEADYNKACGCGCGR